MTLLRSEPASSNRAREQSLDQLHAAAYDTLDSFVSEMNERESAIYLLRLSRGLTGVRKTLAETAAPFGISRERIRQIEKTPG